MNPKKDVSPDKTKRLMIPKITSPGRSPFLTEIISHVVPRPLWHRIENFPAIVGLRLSASHLWGELAGIENKNKTLDGGTLRKCREYSTDVFGSPRYAFELARYCAIHGSWRDGWLPETYFQNEIIRKSIGVPTISRQKTLSAYFIRHASLPDIGYYVNGKYFLRDWKKIEFEQLKQIIFETQDKVVFKINRSMRGRGVFILGPNDLNHTAIRNLGDGCFQEFIQPHPTVPRFGVPSVPTVRLVTTLNAAGDPTARFAYLRLGRLKHSHVISDDSVKVLLCLKTGKLQSIGFLTDWRPVLAHPDTGINFDGVRFPRITDAISLCLDLHCQMPSFLSIGWDLCLDDGGEFKIMEWNQLHDIKFAEAVNGPNFSDLSLEERKK